MLSASASVLRIPTMPPLLFVRCSHSAGDGAADGGVMGDSENNMDNTRTTSSLAHARRRARVLSSRGRVRPRRLGLSKVVDVVSNTNDMLGTTVGAKSNSKYSAVPLTAFGEDLSASCTGHQTPSTFFTGKPHVAGLGHAFLMRNYRASLGKWQTADPMGYPDGWNQLAYCNNDVTGSVDLLGCSIWNDWFRDKKVVDTKTYTREPVLAVKHVYNICGLGSEKEWTWTDGVDVKLEFVFDVTPFIDFFGDVKFKWTYDISNQKKLTYTIPVYKCGAEKHNYTGHMEYDLVAISQMTITETSYDDGTKSYDYQIAQPYIKPMHIVYTDCNE